MDQQAYRIVENGIDNTPSHITDGTSAYAHNRPQKVDRRKWISRRTRIQDRRIGSTGYLRESGSGYPFSKKRLRYLLKEP